MTDYNRNAFESWVVDRAKKSKFKHFSANILLSKYEDGAYKTLWVDSSWIGWKAAIDFVNKEIQR